MLYNHNQLSFGIFMLQHLSSRLCNSAGVITKEEKVFDDSGLLLCKEDIKAILSYATSRLQFVAHVQELQANI